MLGLGISLILISLYALNGINENRIKILEDRCRRLELKTNLMDLKYIDREDLMNEFNYRKSVEDFRKTCADFEQQCKEFNNRNDEVKVHE